MVAWKNYKLSFIKHLSWEHPFKERNERLAKKKARELICKLPVEFFNILKTKDAYLDKFFNASILLTEENERPIGYFEIGIYSEDQISYLKFHLIKTN